MQQGQVASVGYVKVFFFFSWPLTLAVAAP